MASTLEKAEYKAEVANAHYWELINTAFKNPEKAAHRISKVIDAGGIERAQEVLKDRPGLILGSLSKDGQAKEAVQQLADHLPTVRDTNREYIAHKKAIEKIEERNRLRREQEEQDRER
ncbi:MAG: hypothetical protein JJ964_10400 [Rhizobiales bacterium]|nr:hypothetical protein [Hyphomicrobiales bacterium]